MPNMTSTAAFPSAGPLAGRRVLELCSTVAGPACARMLADYGAEVIKIEPFEGDPVRQMGLHEGDISLYAASILRNKQSIALNLKTEEGRALAQAIAAQCDVVIENYRPGKLEQLGLGYEVLSRDNPGVVLVRISGYGQSGPNSYKPGYGTICEAYGGLRHLNGEPDQLPPRISVALTDYLTAIYAAFGATMALLERESSGKGQVIDVSLFEAAFSMLEPDVPAYDRLGVIANRQGSQCPGLAPNNVYPTRDGSHVLIAANNDPIFARLCRVMERPDLLQDPRFASIRARAANCVAIDQEVSRWTGSLESAVVIRLLDEAEVPSSLTYTIADAFADRHFHEREAILSHQHPSLGTIAMAGLVAKLSRTPGAVRHTGPEVGQDTRAVLKRLAHLDDARIDQLLRDRVIKAASPE
ncbi:CaiB/BaiF CoA transferase family protein [Cupriavidus necator]|uniref:CaiB/BaiF CoA transferase family protein n=1 Tax=Cupriavidus necator TaxID=106590 RepID=UPI003F501ED9